MRVTENSSFDLIRDASQRSKSKLESLQNQMATLKKVNTPSDDPVGAAKILQVRTDKVNNEQFANNSKIATGFLENSDHALSEISDILVRAKEIAIGQSSGASANRDTRVAIAEEVLQLYQQAISAANRRIGDRYLFGGYKTQQPPVLPNGEYVGDDGSMMIELGRDVYVSMNVPGKGVFNTEVIPAKFGEDRILASQEKVEEPGQAKGLNVFEELQNLRIGLLTGDLTTIQTSLDHFDSLHAHVNSVRAKVGSRLNGIQNLMAGIERQGISQAQLSSQIEDADLSKVVSDLAQQEMVYKSALQASQKLIQPTLLDFLK